MQSIAQKLVDENKVMDAESISKNWTYLDARPIDCESFAIATWCWQVVKYLSDSYLEMTLFLTILNGWICVCLRLGRRKLASQVVLIGKSFMTVRIVNALDKLVVVSGLRQFLWHSFGRLCLRLFRILCFKLDFKESFSWGSIRSVAILRRAISLKQVYWASKSIHFTASLGLAIGHLLIHSNRSQTTSLSPVSMLRRIDMRPLFI